MENVSKGHVSTGSKYPQAHFLHNSASGFLYKLSMCGAKGEHLWFSF